MVRKNTRTPFESFEGQSQSGHYIRLTFSMLKHDAWKNLKPIAKTLYIHLKMKYRGMGRGVELECTYKEINQKIGLNDKSTKSAFDDLIQKGFIEVIENNQARMKANRYKFSDKWLHFGLSQFEYNKSLRKVVVHKESAVNST